MDPTCPDSDLIYFEIKCEYLLTAINTSRKNVKSIEMKLGRDDFPYLAVNMVVEMPSNNTSTIFNKVPVMVLPRQTWEEFALPYGSTDFDVRGKCPRFSVFKKFISLFKNQRNIKFTLCDDETLTIEAIEDTLSFFTIFQNIAVSTFEGDEEFKGKSETTVDQKKITNWITSLNFQTAPNLSIMIEHRRNMKLFFRIRDDILAQFVISSVCSEDEYSDKEINPFDED